MKRKTVLIYGVTSFVGSNLAEFLKKDYKVVGTYHKNRINIPGVLTLPCDILEKDEVRLIQYSFKPDFTIYAIGLSSVKDSSLNPELADALNTAGLFNVVENCQRYKSRVCYISSAYVFGGEDKSYKERDIPDSSTEFGKTKASAEFYIQKTSLNYIIFRCCCLYGRSLNPRQETWFETLQKKLLLNERVSCDNFVYTGFLDVYYLAIIIKFSIEKDIANRLFQISSNDFLTRYGFAKTYCEVFKDSVGNITKGRWHFPIAKFSTLEYDGGELFFRLMTNNLEGFLNFKMPSIKESLEFTASRLNRISSSLGDAGGGGSSDEIKFI